MEGTDPFHQGTVPWPIHFPQTPSLNTMTLGFGFQHTKQGMQALRLPSPSLIFDTPSHPTLFYIIFSSGRLHPTALILQPTSKSES